MWGSIVNTKAMLVAGLVAGLTLPGTAHAAVHEPLGGQVLNGVVETGQAGFDVAAVGDLNGDRAVDFVVGAPFGNAGKGASAGAAYLFYGPLERSTARLSDADAIFLGAAPGDFVGEDSGAVGDLDGDGLDELVLGAPGSIPGAQPGAAKPGTAYLFHGSRERRRGTILLEPGCLGAGTCDATFTGVHASDFFGFGLPSTPIGDTDGDGRDDLLIGSAGYGGYSGAAYLYYGKRFTGEIAAGAADAVFAGPPAGVATRALTGAGDLDGDGLADFAIAAPGGLVSARPTPGSVYVYYGRKDRRAGSTTTAQADAVLVGELGARAGNGIAGGEDVDGDGLGDLLVGEPGFNAQGQRTPGRAHLIYGSRTRLGGTMQLGGMPGQAVLAGDPSGDELGFAAALGDLDGDGFAEVVAGAPSAVGGAGAVVVFRGAPQRRLGSVALEAADRFLTGEAGERAGAALAAADFNRDRAADLLVGSPAAKAAGPAAGAARVLAGRRDKPVVGSIGGGANVPGAAPAALIDRFTVSGKGCEEQIVAITVPLQRARDVLPAGIQPRPVRGPQGVSTDQVYVYVSHVECDSLRRDDVEQSRDSLSEVAVTIESPDGSPGTHRYHLWSLPGGGDLAASYAALGARAHAVPDARGVIDPLTGRRSATATVPWAESPYAISTQGSVDQAAAASQATYWHLGPHGLVRTAYRFGPYTTRNATGVVTAKPGSPLERLLGGERSVGQGFVADAFTLDATVSSPCRPDVEDCD